MPNIIHSAALVGVDAVPIDVEADITPGLPNFFVVGLPDAAVQESRERVRSALKNHSYPFPRTRIAVNLAPADLRKAGPAYDLPIAVAILRAAEALPDDDRYDRILLIGELSLDGRLRPTCGALSVALLAKQNGFEELILPANNAKEAAMVRGVRVIPANTLTEVIDHLSRKKIISACSPSEASIVQPAPAFDFAAIRGQQQAKRSAEIAAAGGHNILLTGPPGSGKTMLAKAIPGILPSMMESEMFEVSKIHSAAGMSSVDRPIVTTRPFRSPHHTISGAALIGGGPSPRPGEISLAHRGVLFLDEFPEFPRHILEHLRQPLEDGEVAISRVHGKVRFPARFMLVAAQNPCPCGYYGDPSARCTCKKERVLAYHNRISGPLLDRIDLMANMPAVAFTEYFGVAAAETSTKVRERVEAARAIQRLRFVDTQLISNADIPTAKLADFVRFTKDAFEIVATASRTLGLSARGYGRILRVSRTIADLAAETEVKAHHVAEALQYRMAT